MDQVKPGPPDSKTTHSLPSLRLPEIEEPDETTSELTQQITDNQLDDKQQTQDTNLDLVDESITEPLPTSFHKYNLRQRPH